MILAGTAQIEKKDKNRKAWLSHNSDQPRSVNRTQKVAPRRHRVINLQTNGESGGGREL